MAAITVPAIQFLGAAQTVTGSKFLLEWNGTRVLIDCGLFQGLKSLRLRNWDPLPVPASSIHAVVLTHAHLDHSGYLPRLRKEGFQGRIIASRATADLLKILLPDSGHLQEEEAAYHNRHGTSKHLPALPLYTAAEGVATAARVEGVGYDEQVPLAPELTVTFRRAGHILGSAMLTVEVGRGTARRRVIFSGDVGRYGAPILPAPAPMEEPSDYVVVESTYGDRLHDPDPVPHLARVIRKGAARGGAIIVPAFAVGRTQELMYHLASLERAGAIPRLRAYVDSPMAVSAVQIYCDHPEDFDGDMRAMVMDRNCPLQCSDFHLARTPEDSKAINDEPGPVLIVAPSGMASGGRVLHHLRRRLPDPRTTVLLVGYQAAGTRGRSLQDGARFVRIVGADVPVRARVETVSGLSAHADADGLVRWLRTAPALPRAAFVVHGEPGPASALGERMRKELGWTAVVPSDLERVTLS